MTKQRGKIGKYSKISLQKKYELLRQCQSNDKNLRETSKHLQINYSTAKTILFQFQNHKIKSPLTFLDKRLNEHKIDDNDKSPRLVANYREFIIPDHTKRKVKIECTINGQKSRTSTDTQESVKAESFKIKLLYEEHSKQSKSLESQRNTPNSDEQTLNQIDYQASIQKQNNTPTNKNQEVYENCDKTSLMPSFYDFFQYNPHENGNISHYLIECQYPFALNDGPTWFVFFQNFEN